MESEHATGAATGPSDLAWYAADAVRPAEWVFDALEMFLDREERLAEAQANEDAIQHERFEACRDAVALLQTAMLVTVSHDMPTWTMAYHAKGRLEQEQANYLHGGRVEQPARGKRF